MSYNYATWGGLEGCRGGMTLTCQSIQDLICLFEYQKQTNMLMFTYHHYNSLSIIFFFNLL